MSFKARVYSTVAATLLIVAPLAAQAFDPAIMQELREQAEREADAESLARRSGEFANIPDPIIRNRAEALARQRAGLRPLRLSSKPWLAPNGDQLVGIVDNRRMLTKPQLDRRVNMLLRQMPAVDEASIGSIQRDGAVADPRQLAEDRRIILESQLLGEWLETTALALHAEQIGLRASDEEINAAIEELTRQNAASGDGSEGGRMRMLGFPEAELRQEVRDALLVEKLVQQRTRETVSEGQMRELYRSQPRAFLIPTRARVWHLFYPMVRTPTKRQASELHKEMARLRKQLDKARTQADFASLQREVSGRGDVIQREIGAAGLPGIVSPPSLRDNVVLSDMGWVAQGDLVPGAVQKTIFELEPGEISKILISDLGLHVVKVVERVEGQQGTFNDARPQIEAMLFDKVKEIVFESLKQNMKMFSDSSGLKQYTELQSDAAAGPMATSPSMAVRTAEPDLAQLRRPRIDPNFRPDLTPPPVAKVLEDNLLKRAAAGDPDAPKNTDPAANKPGDRFYVPPMTR